MKKLLSFILFLSDIIYFLCIGFIINFFKESFFLIIILSVIFYYEGIYTFRYDFWQEMKKIFKSLFLSFLLTIFMIYFFYKKISLNLILFYFLILFVSFPIYKRFIKSILFKFSFFREKVKVIDNSDQIRKEIKNNWYLGMEENDKNFNIVLINSNDFSLFSLNKEIEKHIYDKKIYLIPYLIDIDFSNSNIFEYQNIRKSVIYIENKLLKLKNILIKNVFDFILALLIFPFFLTIHIIISILIKIDSKGSIFFKQERIGKNGKIFTCYKYRTMYENGEELLKKYLSKHPEEIKYYEKYHKYKNDPRITKIGRFLRTTSLDELPQIINVLKGEMSFVGPRPYMIDEVQKIKDLNIILKVKPGITGLWQVSGRNNLTFKERIKIEKWYIKNWSLWLDFVILIKTIKVIIFKIGAK